MFNSDYLIPARAGMIRVVSMTKANTPKASVTDRIEQDLQKQDAELPELHIERAYLS